ncbi:hypothetical protein BJX62DRAFT_248369 [Aspergillus germanicus]
MRRHIIGKREDPYLHCTICGSEVLLREPEVIKERADWVALCKKRGKAKSRSIIVTSAEVEATDFKKHVFGWMHLYRAILDEPATGRVYLSGIDHGSLIDWYPGPVPTDPDRARLSGFVRKESRWNVDFHMVNLFEPDRNREAGRRIGFPAHPHCWLLVDRVIGFAKVLPNLRAYTQAVMAFWPANEGDWDPPTQHLPGTDSCFEQGVFGRREDVTPHFNSEDEAENYFYRLDTKGMRDEELEHALGSPLRTPDIQELMQVATRPRPRTEKVVSRLPVELALMIVDLIWCGRPLCQERIDDTRNTLEAFQWTLPDSYWKKRCEPELVYEVGDLEASGKPVDWAVFCLGLEELMVDPHWFCVSGLRFRQRILRVLKGIKERFEEIVARNESG